MSTLIATCSKHETDTARKTSQHRRLDEAWPLGKPMPPSCIEVGVVLQVGDEGGRNTSARQKMLGSCISMQIYVELLLGPCMSSVGLNNVTWHPARSQAAVGHVARLNTPRRKVGAGGDRRRATAGGRATRRCRRRTEKQFWRIGRAALAAQATSDTATWCVRAGRIPATVEPERDA